MKGSKKHATIAMLSIVAILAAGCSGNQGGEGTKAEVGKKEAPVALNILSNFSIAQPPGPDNPVTKEFENRTNTKLNITWVSDGVYNDKLNVLLASGELPDLIKLPNTTSIPQFQTMVKQGAFWDLTPF